MTERRTIVDVYNDPNTRTQQIQNGDDVFLIRKGSSDMGLPYQRLINDTSITTAAYIPATQVGNQFGRRLTVQQAMNIQPTSIFNQDQSLKCNPYSAQAMYSLSLSGGVNKTFKGKNEFISGDRQLSLVLSRSNQKALLKSGFIDLSLSFTIGIFQRITLYKSYMNIVKKGNQLDLYISQGNLYLKCGSISIMVQKNHKFLNRNILYWITKDGNNRVTVFANNRQLCKKVQLTQNLINQGLPYQFIGNDYGLKQLLYVNAFNYQGINNDWYFNNGRPDLVNIMQIDKWESNAQQLGLVAQMNPNSIEINNGEAKTWHDRIQGYPCNILNNPKCYLLQRDLDILNKSLDRVLIKQINSNGNTDIQIPSNWIIDQILFQQNTNSSNFLLSNQLGNPITMNSNAATSGKCTLIKKLLSTRDNTNIQISGLTGSVKLIIKIKKVLNIV